MKWRLSYISWSLENPFLAEALQKDSEGNSLANENNTREKSGLHKEQESTRNDNYGGIP